MLSPPTKQVSENKYPNVPSWEEAISYLLNPKLVGVKSDKSDNPKNPPEAEADDQSRRRPKRRRSGKRGGSGNRSQAPKKTES
ncbi:MAG TPA: hypothetical protein DCM07_00160 [Planctomycetaceae bacterium]|nr:hypothetical protein [Planctomycetaceae bacterium]